jgi:hypothetical protein
MGLLDITGPQSAKETLLRHGCQRSSEIAQVGICFKLLQMKLSHWNTNFHGLFSFPHEKMAIFGHPPVIPSLAELLEPLDKSNHWNVL